MPPFFQHISRKLFMGPALITPMQSPTHLELRGKYEVVNSGSQIVGTSNTAPKQFSLGVGLVSKF